MSKSKQEEALAALWAIAALLADGPLAVLFGLMCIAAIIPAVYLGIKESREEAAWDAAQADYDRRWREGGEEKVCECGSTPELTTTPDGRGLTFKPYCPDCGGRVEVKEERKHGD